MEGRKRAASEKRRQQAQASPASQLSKRLSTTHSVQDLTMLWGQDFDPFGGDDDMPPSMLEIERNPVSHARPETSRQQVRQPMGPQVINQGPSPIKISNESPSMYMTPDSDSFSSGETLEGLKAMTPGTSKILEDLLPGASQATTSAAAGIGVGAAGTRKPFVGTKRSAPQGGKAKTNKKGKQPAKKGRAGPSRQGPDNRDF